jgi:hypothetical protein
MIKEDNKMTAVSNGTLCSSDGGRGLLADTLEMRRRIEIIGDYIKDVEERLSAHDSIMDAASAGIYEMSAISESISYARDALARLSRISDAMESIGGEVTRLRWEICKMNRMQKMA